MSRAVLAGGLPEGSNIVVVDLDHDAATGAGLLAAQSGNPAVHPRDQAHS